MFTKLNAYWIPKHYDTKTKWTVRWNSADEPDTRGGEPGLPGRWGLQSMQECVATQTSCLEWHTLGSGWVLSVSPPQLFQWLLLPGAPSRSGVSWTRLLLSGAQSRAGLVAPSQETQGANNPMAKEKWTHSCALNTDPDSCPPKVKQCPMKTTNSFFSVQDFLHGVLIYRTCFHKNTRVGIV